MVKIFNIDNKRYASDLSVRTLRMILMVIPQGEVFPAAHMSLFLNCSRSSLWTGGGGAMSKTISG